MAKPKNVYVACDTRGDVLMINTNHRELVDDVSKYKNRSIVIWKYTSPKEFKRFAVKPKKGVGKRVGTFSI